MKTECKFVEIFGRERYKWLKPVIEWAYKAIPKTLEKMEWRIWSDHVAGLASREEWKIIFNEVLKDITCEGIQEEIEKD